MSVDPTLTVDAVTNVIVQAKDPQILGLYLPGLKKELLQIIETENRHNQLQLARKISKAWINNRVEEATWEKLIIALEVGIVGENYLAEQVRSDIHIRRDSTTSTGSSLTNSFASLSTGSDLFSSENEESLTDAKCKAVQVYAKNHILSGIKRSFKQLTNQIAANLESKNITVSMVKSNIVVDKCPHFYSRTKHVRKIRDLFIFFEVKKLWSYDHYDLVGQVIAIVVDETMQKLLDAYIKKLNGYQVAQELASKLPYYLDKEYPEWLEEKFESPFCNDLRRKLRVCVNISNESLQFVGKLWDNIRKRYSIPCLTALLYSIVFGSLEITWLIQPSSACCILSELFASATFLEEHLIMNVTLDDECIYDEHSGFANSKIICSLWMKQAILSGRIEKLRQVLAQPDVDMNETLTEDGATPLIIASQCGHEDLVSFLIEAGADTTVTLANGETALHIAVNKVFPSIAVLLHKENSELIGLLDNAGFSPLMKAAAKNQIEVIEAVVKAKLEQCGADSKSIDIPTLGNAFLVALKEGHYETVKILHRYGATTFNTAEEGESPLVVAAGAGHTQVVEYFLEIDQEMNPDTLNFEEKSAALFLAIEGKHFEIVDILLRSKFKKDIIDSKHSDGMTPLVLAVLKQSPKLVDMLMTTGADFNLANRDGMTPLMLAAEAGQVDSVRLLVEKGAEVTLPHELSGKTALHFASVNGHTDVVELLAQPEHQALASKVKVFLVKASSSFAEPENMEYDSLQYIENISSEIPPKSLNYVRVCFLLAAILPQNAMKSVLNGENLISQIYYETLKDKEGGLAKFWYVLNETQVCPADRLADLKKYVTKTYFVPALLTPMVHLRSMILKIVDAIANDEAIATCIINTAGDTFNPRTTLNTLSKPLDNKNYTVPLLEFFELAEKQLDLEPDNLENLRLWLSDAGCKRVIRDYLDTFDPTKEIRILSARHRQWHSLRTDSGIGSVEEDARPDKGESELVPGKNINVI